MYRFRQYVTASSTSSWVDGKCPGGTSFHKSRESNSFVDILCKFVGDKDSINESDAVVRATFPILHYCTHIVCETAQTNPIIMPRQTSRQ